MEVLPSDFHSSWILSSKQYERGKFTNTQSTEIGPSELYDPIYNLSSERDHARATFKAHTSTDRVKRVPVYKSMFSEVRHHPRFQMRLDVTDPVPKFISRQWRGYADQARDALIRYTTFNYDPSVSVPARSHQDARVSGTNRYKYFRRPIIPFLQQVPPDVLLATTRQDPLAATDQAQLERARTPPTKTVETQTDYRDSEAQTDPYTPEYVVRPGSQPELLTLATLSYGRGLPAGLAEVEMIERARTKRAWEATLPPLSDTDQLDKRRKMMDEMERKEWALREQEIEKLQEARLDVLKKLLAQREQHHQELNTKRLDRLWAKKQEEKEERVKKIRNEHIKTIRKLTKKRSEVEGKLERRDIVRDYSDFGSQAYAPMTRIGVFLDRGSEQFVVKSHYLSTYQGLLELENSLPDFVTAPRVKAPKPKTVTKAGFTKRRYRQERELAEIHEVIKDNKNKEEELPKPLRFLQKIEKPIPRPPTPAVQVPSEEEEQRDLAIIFLQQVIRGRAIQNMMFEGKEKRIELIRELRSTHALQDAEQQMKKQEKQATLALQRQRRLHDHKESYIDEALGQMEGECLGDMLDFLGKELIRLQEERRIHAFSMLAERQRRIREAEESGRRQLEQRRRREEDEIFKQTIKVHQDSVDTYLQDIILGSVDKTADEQARKEVDEQAEIINDIAYDIEDTRTELQSEEIVSELVHGFLLPEAQKCDMREKVHRHQRKYLAAAHREIHKVGEEIIPMFPRKPTAPAAEPTPQTAEAAPTTAEATPPTTTQTETPADTVPQTAEAQPQDEPKVTTSPVPKQEEQMIQTEKEVQDVEKSAAPEPQVEEAQLIEDVAALDALQAEQEKAEVADSSITKDKPPSRPSSKAGSQPSSRPTSAQKTSRPSSAQKTSRPPSAQKVSSRPSSAQKAGSRRGSSSSQKSQKSRTATPEAPAAGPDLSIQGVEVTQSGSPTPKVESPKPAGTPTGSKPSSRRGSAAKSQSGSRPSSRPSSATKQ